MGRHDAFINREGSDVTLSTGKVIKAIPDESPEALTERFGLRVDQIDGGRPCLFFVTKTDFDLIPKGTTLTYDGQPYSQHDFRAVKARNEVRCMVILGLVGNNPA